MLFDAPTGTRSIILVHCFVRPTVRPPPYLQGLRFALVANHYFFPRTMSSRTTTRQSTSTTPSSSRLFSALASIEKTDGVAAQRRLRSRTVSLQRSKVASVQTELQNVLLELRILTQRCLTEEECLHDGRNDTQIDGRHDSGVGGTEAVMEEVDTLLRNLLATRKELMGKIMISNEYHDDDDDVEIDDEILQNEYHAALRDNIWKPTLDKLHSNLTSRSGGTSAAASEFKGGIVGTTFWEQVQSTVEHEQSRLPKINNDNDDDDEGGKPQRPTFDDSKLYQRMLTDFVSTRSSSTTSKGCGGVSDPAREAAERLGRALRKRSGADVDISSLWGDEETNTPGVGSSKRKKTETITTAVDRRASKGRKIRYAVHPKLVNFAFPIARPVPTIMENVWFNSLFGGVGKLR